MACKRRDVPNSRLLREIMLAWKSLQLHIFEIEMFTCCRTVSTGTGTEGNRLKKLVTARTGGAKGEPEISNF